METGKKVPSKQNVVIVALSITTAALATAVVALLVAVMSKDPRIRGGGGSPSSYAVPPLTDMACPNYSPTWPSEGGPDCMYACDNGTRSVGTAFFNVFPDDYTNKITAAGKLVLDIDPAHTIYVEGEHGFMDSHVSFSYYCCYSNSDLKVIKGVLEAHRWDPISIKLSYATCAVDGPSLEHVSFIIMLDEQSNAAMMQWVAQVEAEIRAAGIPIHVPRINQEPYHTTLAVVNGTGYPVAKAIEALNSEFPEGGWLSEPLALTKPCNAHGNTPAGFFC